jgi:protoheme IX farnesyltransferase
MGLSLGGITILYRLVNPVSAGLAAAGFLFYVVIYSLLLKPSTPQNIVLGGAAGAIPALVGWAASRGGLNIQAFFLFALVFFWTPPHFWALALLKRKDYARAGIPMFPVVYGQHATRTTILLYSVQLVALTYLLPAVGLGGLFYLGFATVLGGGFLLFAWKVWREGSNSVTWGLYRYSNMYLALIFLGLVLDSTII